MKRTKSFIWVIALLLFTSLAFSSEINSPLAQDQNNPIPKALIAYDTAAGVQLFDDAKNKADFWKLSRYFVTQENQAFCGVASLTMVLNALGGPRPYSANHSPYRLFTQNNLFTQSVTSQNWPQYVPAYISGRGLTLQKFVKLAQLSGLKVTYHFADKKDKQSYEAFMKETISALNSGKQFVVVNFYRKGLDEIGGGHFSPLAAYNAKADRFLLMDVSRYKYPPVWVKSQELWAAMATPDSTSHHNRGYVILSD